MVSLGCEITKKKAMWLYPKVFGHSPPERWGHSACFDHGHAYIFGGCCGGQHFRDVLKLDLHTMSWTTLATTAHGPGPRDSHSAVLVRNKMIVFGGTNGSNKVNDLHVLDITSKEWKQPNCMGNPPSPRESHTATLVGHDKLVIFGGSGEGEGNYLNDLYFLDLGTMKWNSPVIKGDLPVPRDSHSAVAVGNRLVVYGGDCGDRYIGDVDVFDMDTFTWSKLDVQGLSPGIRAGHASVNIGTKIYVLGGVGDRHYYNDVWVLDILDCSWTRLDVCGQQPHGRFSHAAVVTGSDIMIYGGCGEDERPLNEILVLQLAADHPNCGIPPYNIPMSKTSGSYSYQDNRRFLHGTENNSESKCYRLISDKFHHPKRRRRSSSKAWEVESEQEEHSLSLSQHSSPSQSDQEQITPIQKHPESSTGLHRFHLLRNSNSTGSIHHRTQERHCEAFLTGREDQKHSDSLPIHSLIGADVRGKVDGAFDSGLLMTATVNGRIFRGVLFAPGPGIVSRAPTIQPVSPSPTMPKPCLGSSQVEELKPSSGQMMSRFQVIKSVPGKTKEPKLSSDLQGVVLTLGPANGHT